MNTSIFFWAILLLISAASTVSAVDTKVAQQSEESQLKKNVGADTDAIKATNETLEEPTRERVAEWIDNLRSDSFQARRESFVKLWRAGKPALAAVQSAMQSTDKQQAETAATLEVLIRLNVTLEDPAESADLLNELTTSPELALVKLCKKGYWSVANQLLELNGDLLNSFKSSPSAYARMNALVDEAIEQDQLNLAWPVVRQVLPYQQALWIAQRQGLEPPKVDSADPSAQAWRLFIQHKYDDMLKSAAPVKLKVDLATRAFRWDAFRDPELMQGVIGRRQSAGQLASRSVMLEFAGQLTESEALWQSILPQTDPLKPDTSAPSKTESTKPSNDVPEDDDDELSEKEKTRLADAKWAEQWKQLRAQQVRTDRAVLNELEKISSDPANLDRVLAGMLLSGRAQAVQDFLLEYSPKDAWSLCIFRGDQAAALASQGIAPDLSNFEEWLTRRRAELNYLSNQFFDDSANFRSTVQLANDLQSLGMTEQANRLFDVLVSVCRVSRQRSESYWQVLASTMTRAEARVRFLNLFTANETTLEEKNRAKVLASIYPECSMVASVLYELAPEIADANGRPSRLAALEQLYLYNRQPFEPNASKSLVAWLRRTRNNLSQSDELSSIQLHELARLADGIGHPELALEFARESGQASIELWAYAGRTLQERGDLKNALQYFSAIRQTDSGHQEAIVDEANALLMLGEVSDATKLQKSRWLRPLMVYGRSSWYSVAERLNEAKRYELAKEYFEPAFLLAGCDDSEDETVQQSILVSTAYSFAAAAEELKDFELAANLNRTILTNFVNAQKSRNYSVAFYATVAIKERGQRAILAAQAGDIPAFERQATVTESLQPQGINLVEDTFHELVASGNQTIAEKWFARYEQRLLAHIERWPRDATVHNNLAWMYARCNLKLNEALEHSQIAVELSPNSPVLLDTLAEVQFRLNQYSAAVSSMQRCIQLDPRDPHYRRQLDRFLKAELEARK